MSKVRIYIEPKGIRDFVEIADREIIHKVKDVLRFVEGEDIYIFDGEGKEYVYKIEAVNKNSISLRKERLEREENPPLRKVILGFPLIKEDKVDLILQKATELGVFAFAPFMCEHSLRIKPSEAKIQRWQRIVIEAARQSIRLWIPQIYGVRGVDDIVKSGYKVKLAACYEGKNLGELINSEQLKESEILVVVGPEGDFSPLEYEVLDKNGFLRLKLSSNILRVETAAIFVAGLVSYTG